MKLEQQGEQFIPLNDLSRAAKDRDDLKHAMIEVFESGMLIHGPNHRSFERELAEYLNVLDVRGVASGTDALEISLRAVGCQRGDTVLTVANAGGYATLAAGRIGASVRLADVDSTDMLMTPTTLKDAWDDDVTVVIVTHLFGNPADLRGIQDFCAGKGVKLVEDCAQGLGAKLGIQSVGTFGDSSAFSFYPTKNLGAFGDGGAIASNHTEVLEKITRLRQYGWSTRYSIQSQGGQNSRLDELQAAVLRRRLKQLDEMNQVRRNLLRRFASALEGTGARMVEPREGCTSSGHLAVLDVGSASLRQLAIEHFASLGIETSLHYPIPDWEQPGFQEILKSSDVLENTKNAIARIITVPCFPELTESEICRIEEGLSTIPT